jgi:hypothetical protein
MKWLVAAILAAFLVYILYDEFKGEAPLPSFRRKRLCDYYVGGSTQPSAIQKGIRLLEAHVYSDERDQPVVSTKIQSDSLNFADENVSFEQVCIDIVNDAFPSEEPFILAIVSHTDKSVTLNRVAYHLKTIARKFLTEEKDLEDARFDQLANKLIVVSGGTIHGTDLEPLLNMSWSNSNLQRLTHQQALHPRDSKELASFNRDFITLVGPEPELKTISVNPDMPFAYGCQWNVMSEEPLHFTEKSYLTR